MESHDHDAELRWCTLCYERKPLSEFHRFGDGYMHWCKSCRKDYDAAYYRQRREIVVAQKRQRAQEQVAWMRTRKAAPCVDCGGRFHPAAMTFDHLPGAAKRSDIATLARRHSVAVIEAEIAKCELVCANCHAVRTFNRRQGEQSAA
jgi:hypothetical protein